ncbi:hypothetical protein CDG61_15940 [Acinetobacter sp. WCHAc010052]|jgi:hypothetical protein|nr:hypothetical protein CDG61_15940 [Acinetobacter sp. WCHAc010052]
MSVDALEKSLLIKELRDLTHDLERQALSFYEIARSKKRIHEIFELCDEPIFKKQVLGYKAQINPEATTLEFADQTLYRQSFRGYFQEDSLLEEALYAHPESGWAFLHHASEGWQIWLIPAADRTALISEWGSIEAVFSWMMEQLHHYHCLKTDQELELIAQQPKNRFHKYKHLSTEHISHSLPETAEPDMTFNNSPADAQLSLKPRDISAYFRKKSGQSSEVEVDETHPLTATDRPAQNLPVTLQLGAHQAIVTVLNFPEALEQQLYGLKLPEVAQFTDLLIFAPDQENVLQRPVYLAEQISTQGRFIKYLALFGAEDEMQAIRLARVSAEQQGYDLASVRMTNWASLEDQLLQHEAFFEVFTEKATVVWNKDTYFPYIPAQLIHTQKFIQFDETAAETETPVILLKERQKIRVIHGQKRLELSQMEQAFPHLLLDRQQGISWQLIQRVINRLEQPIEALQLYEAIQVYSEE